MPLSVLIVEEQTRNGSSLAGAVGDRFDVVRTVSSASEAAEVALQLRPHLVITPFPAVTRTGQPLTALLKGDPRTSDCRIIAYSDWAWSNTRAKALEQGCAAFVATSAPIEELLSAIDALIDGIGSNGADPGDSLRTGLFD